MPAPLYGQSTKQGYVTYSGSAAGGGYNKSAPTYTRPIAPTPTPSPTRTTAFAPTSTAPAPASSTSYNLEEDVNRQKEEEARRRAEFEAQERGAINAEFEPIFAELDRQAGFLPTQQKQYEEQVGNLSESQRLDVEAERARAGAGLDRAVEKEESLAKSSLRGLDEDIRSQLQAREYYFGARGAGDSSAPIAASEAITKAGLQARGKVFGQRSESIKDIELKRADVNTLASEQLRKVNEFKQTKLFEVAQEFTGRLDQLNAQRVNATAQKAQAISQLIRGLNQDFIGRLRQLDDAVTNYKSSIDTWQRQRTADLEDYKTKIGLSSQYSSSSQPVKLSFEKITNPLTNETTVVGIDPYTGKPVSTQKFQGLGFQPLPGGTLPEEEEQQSGGLRGLLGM